MSKHKVPEGGKTETEPTPISPLYEVQGKQCRLYTDGWHCTCHQPDCQHIEAAKVMHKEARAAAKEEQAEEAK